MDPGRFEVTQNLLQCLELITKPPPLSLNHYQPLVDFNIFHPRLDLGPMGHIHLNDLLPQLLELGVILGRNRRKTLVSCPEFKPARPSPPPL
ncbi:hypothetical protein ACLOJK_012205 [Asimina triloba]